MPELTSSRHAFQPPLYQGNGRTWHAQFTDAVNDIEGAPTWDVAGLRAMVSYAYSCGDHTLVEQVKRRPWLAEVSDCQPPRLETPPPHELRGLTLEQIVQELQRRLIGEARKVCAGRRAIYLTLSGGLDSRIVAGTLAHLKRAGELECRPVAVTWGYEKSRDVVYGREVAKRLDFAWTHVPMGPEHIWENVDAAAAYLGALITPSNLHRYLWFKNVERDALVLCGSYGDSVGRGEFSGRSLLELRPIAPGDALGLLRPEVAAAGDLQLARDADALRSRMPGAFPYVDYEHQQFQCYLRGMLGHAMSLIGQFCDLYQMFTDPDVYGFIWSVHPSLRTNDVYYRLLLEMGNGLAELPWARTNRAVRGKTRGADSKLSSEFHQADDWIRGVLYDRLRQLVEPEWFEATGVFSGAAVTNLDRALREKLVVNGAPGDHVSRMYGWLASVRLLADRAAQANRAILRPELAPPPVAAAGFSAPRYSIPDGRMRRALRSAPSIRRWLKSCNANRLRRRFLRDHPANWR